jgi:hypothetical protein
MKAAKSVPRGPSSGGALTSTDGDSIKRATTAASDSSESKSPLKQARHHEPISAGETEFTTYDDHADKQQRDSVQAVIQQQRDAQKELRPHTEGPTSSVDGSDEDGELEATPTRRRTSLSEDNSDQASAIDIESGLDVDTE